MCKAPLPNLWISGNVSSFPTSAILVYFHIPEQLIHASKKVLELVGIDFLSMYFRMQQIVFEHHQFFQEKRVKRYHWKPYLKVGISARQDWYSSVFFCFLIYPFLEGRGGIWANRGGGWEGGATNFLWRGGNYLSKELLIEFHQNDRKDKLLKYI